MVVRILSQRVKEGERAHYEERGSIFHKACVKVTPTDT